MKASKILNKYDLIINQKFNRKKELEISIKNTSNKIIKDFKICFSTIYSINSIKKAFIKYQIARYYEVSPLRNEKIKPKSNLKFKILFKKENINFLNSSSGIEGVFILNNKEKIIKTKINNLNFENKLKKIKYKDILKNKDTIHVIPEPYYFNLTNQLFNCSKGFHTRDKKIANSFKIMNMIFGKEKFFKKNIKGVKIQYYKSKFNDEEYKIIIKNRNIKIFSNNNNGIFYAMITISQMLLSNNGKIKIGTIIDKPRFSWRGFHLDCARQFYPKNKILRLLNFMAIFKLNRFHWHLTDNEAWRLELKSYPELTKKLSYRGYNNLIPPTYGGGIGPTGGFYSKKDIKDIIKHAKKLSIEIMPEIDIPAHSWAIMKYMKKLNEKDDRSWNNFKGNYSNNTLNPGLEFTWKFLNNVFNEVSKLFPFSIIHIGGDERPKNSWTKSPSVKKLMKKHKLKNLNLVQEYFVNKIKKINKKHNKNTGIWNDGLKFYSNKNLKKNLLIFAWQDLNIGYHFLKKGFSTILSPAQYCYFDMSYNNSENEKGLLWAGSIETKKILDWEPVPKKYQSISKKIVGIQGHLWSETITNINLMDIMINPRLIALSEVAWSKSVRRSWPIFRGTLKDMIKITKKIGWKNHKF